MWLGNFREWFNLSLYNSKNPVLGLFRWTHIVVALSMIGVLIYSYDFSLSPASQDFLHRIVELSCLCCVIRYFVKIVYDYNPLQHMRNNWVETIIVFLLIIEVVTYNVFGVIIASRFFESIGIKGFSDFSNLTIQLFFVAYVFMEMFKKQI